MIWICRVSLLLVFSLFWGGLTFYTGFVVRISHDVLADPMDGGLITKRVTVLLQYFGAVCAGLMLLNTLLVKDAPKQYFIILMVCSVVLGCAVSGLFLVHGRLDAVIDVSAGEIIDRDAFTILHRRYNQLTTIQWIFSTLYIPVVVAAWRRLDCRQG